MITKPVCPIGVVDFLDCRTCYWQRDGKCAFKRESKGKLISCPYCQAKFQTNDKPEPSNALNAEPGSWYKRV